MKVVHGRDPYVSTRFICNRDYISTRTFRLFINVVPHRLDSRYTISPYVYRPLELDRLCVPYSTSIGPSFTFLRYKTRLPCRTRYWTSNLSLESGNPLTFIKSGRPLLSHSDTPLLPTSPSDLLFFETSILRLKFEVGFLSPLEISEFVF